MAKGSGHMRKTKRIGKVILAGAGPGAPGLLTLKAAEVLCAADVVVYDRLVNQALLEFAPRAEKIFVGKTGNVGARHALPQRMQNEINRLLVRLARRGKCVVRLKGGDPFIFGRGGEEAEFLAKYHVPFEVIPGVSAGTGAPAYAGIPLTDRRFASQVTFVTGHEDPANEKSQVDWKKLAQLGGTLVSFMGVKNLPKVIEGLLAGGRSVKTPVAVIEWGTLPHERVVTGTLGSIQKLCRAAKIESPALTVVGEVVSLRRKLHGRAKKPLAGKTILVTRARAQASELVRRLSEKGARVLEFPTIEILPPSRPEEIDREAARLSHYDWVVFTSRNGVRFFFERLKALGKDARIFSGVRLAAIGEKTAQALQAEGLSADLVPGEFTSRALFEHLKKRGEIRGRKFLLARADIAPPDFRQALGKEGATVTEIETYRTRPAAGVPPKLFMHQKIDYVTFTSSSTVKNFFEALPGNIGKKIGARFVTIGPVTSRTLREYGFKPYREAKVHTVEGLVEVLLNGGGKKP